MTEISDRDRYRKRLLMRRVRILLLALAFLAPILTFIVIGMSAVSAHPNSWLILGSIAIFSSICAVGVKLMSPKATVVIDTQEDDHEPTNIKKWSSQEKRIWQAARVRISELLSESADYGAVLQQHPIVLAGFMADEYKLRHKLDLNAIEVLTLLEEVSKRYRVLLRKRIPLIEQVTLRQLVFLTDINKSKWVRLGKKYLPWLSHARQGLMNPAGKAVDLVFGGIASEVGREALLMAEMRMKRMFLLECAEVLMDLYSGRFTIAEDELSHSSAYSTDAGHMADSIEPLRIVLVGQVSAGKSTLVNLLSEAIVAEVDPLPSSDKKLVYETHLSDDLALNICDLPGLDADSASQDLAFSEAIQADLVIWALRANQSARALDKELSDRISQHFMHPDQVANKPPKLVGVLTHTDRLVAQQNSNNHQSPSDVIADAIQFNSDLLELDAVIAVQQDRPNPIGGLTEFIESSLEEAIQVQLNRRRQNSSFSGIAKQLSRVGDGSASLVKGLFSA